MIDITDTDIFKILISRKKDYIKELGTLLDCQMASNLNKEAMAFALSDFILNHSGVWMCMLSVREITLIEELLKHKPGYRYKAGIMPFPTALEGFRLINAEIQDDITTYWASGEMLDMYRRGIEDAKAFIERHNFMEYEMFAMGALNIYGVMNAGSFFEILMKAQIPIETKNKMDGRKNTDPDPMVFMSTSLLCRLYQYQYEGKVYNFNPGMSDPERHIKEQLSRKDIKEYKPFPMEKILDAGQYSPLCSAGIDLPQSKELLSALLGDVKKDFKNAWKSSFLDVMEYHDFFIAAQEDVHRLTEIISQSKQFKSFEEVQSVVGKLTAFANAIPRWDLKGWSSEEIVKKHEQPHLKPLPPQGFTPGAFVPKVGRNDPCPCGSGKKYKECHGKYHS